MAEDFYEESIKDLIQGWTDLAEVTFDNESFHNWLFEAFRGTAHAVLKESWNCVSTDRRQELNDILNSFNVSVINWQGSSHSDVDLSVYCQCLCKLIESQDMRCCLTGRGPMFDCGSERERELLCKIGIDALIQARDYISAKQLVSLVRQNEDKKEGYFVAVQQFIGLLDGNKLELVLNIECCLRTTMLYCLVFDEFFTTYSDEVDEIVQFLVVRRFSQSEPSICAKRCSQKLFESWLKLERIKQEDIDGDSVVSCSIEENATNFCNLTDRTAEAYELALALMKQCGPKKLKFVMRMLIRCLTKDLNGLQKTIDAEQEHTSDKSVVRKAEENFALSFDKLAEVLQTVVTYNDKQPWNEIITNILHSHITAFSLDPTQERYDTIGEWFEYALNPDSLYCEGRFCSCDSKRCMNADDSGLCSASVAFVGELGKCSDISADLITMLHAKRYKEFNISDYYTKYSDDPVFYFRQRCWLYLQSRLCLSGHFTCTDIAKHLERSNPPPTPYLSTQLAHSFSTQTDSVGVKFEVHPVVEGDSCQDSVKINDIVSTPSIVLPSYIQLYPCQQQLLNPRCYALPRQFSAQPGGLIIKPSMSSVIEQPSFVVPNNITGYPVSSVVILERAQPPQPSSSSPVNRGGISSLRSIRFSNIRKRPAEAPLREVVSPNSDMSRDLNGKDAGCSAGKTTADVSFLAVSSNDIDSGQCMDFEVMHSGLVFAIKDERISGTLSCVHSLLDLIEAFDGSSVPDDIRNYLCMDSVAVKSSLNAGWFLFKEVVDDLIPPLNYAESKAQVLDSTPLICTDWMWVDILKLSKQSVVDICDLKDNKIKFVDDGVVKSEISDSDSNPLSDPDVIVNEFNGALIRDNPRKCSDPLVKYPACKLLQHILAKTNGRSINLRLLLENGNLDSNVCPKELRVLIMKPPAYVKLSRLSADQIRQYCNPEYFERHYSDDVREVSHCNKQLLSTEQDGEFEVSFDDEENGGRLIKRLKQTYVINLQSKCVVQLPADLWVLLVTEKQHDDINNLRSLTEIEFRCDTIRLKLGGKSSTVTQPVAFNSQVIKQQLSPANTVQNESAVSKSSQSYSSIACNLLNPLAFGQMDSCRAEMKQSYVVDYAIGAEVIDGGNTDFNPNEAVDIGIKVLVGKNPESIRYCANPNIDKSFPPAFHTVIEKGIVVKRVHCVICEKVYKADFFYCHLTNFHRLQNQTGGNDDYETLYKKHFEVAETVRENEKDVHFYYEKLMIKLSRVRNRKKNGPKSRRRKDGVKSASSLKVSGVRDLKKEKLILEKLDKIRLQMRSTNSHSKRKIRTQQRWTEDDDEPVKRGRKRKVKSEDESDFEEEAYVQKVVGSPARKRPKLKRTLGDYLKDAANNRCDVCDDKFSNKNSFKRHVSEGHRFKLDVIEDYLTNGPPPVQLVSAAEMSDSSQKENEGVEEAVNSTNITSNVIKRVADTINSYAKPPQKNNGEKPAKKFKCPAELLNDEVANKLRVKDLIAHDRFNTCKVCEYHDYGSMCGLRRHFHEVHRIPFDRVQLELQQFKHLVTGPQKKGKSVVNGRVKTVMGEALNQKRLVSIDGPLKQGIKRKRQKQSDSDEGDSYSPNRNGCLQKIRRKKICSLYHVTKQTIQRVIDRLLDDVDRISGPPVTLKKKKGQPKSITRSPPLLSSSDSGNPSPTKVSATKVVRKYVRHNQSYKQVAETPKSDRDIELDNQHSNNLFYKKDMNAMDCMICGIEICGHFEGPGAIQQIYTHFSERHSGSAPRLRYHLLKEGVITQRSRTPKSPVLPDALHDSDLSIQPQESESDITYQCEEFPSSSGTEAQLDNSGFVKHCVQKKRRVQKVTQTAVVVQGAPSSEFDCSNMDLSCGSPDIGQMLRLDNSRGILPNGSPRKRNKPVIQFKGKARKIRNRCELCDTGFKCIIRRCVFAGNYIEAKEHYVTIHEFEEHEWLSENELVAVLKNKSPPKPRIRKTTSKPPGRPPTNGLTPNNLHPADNGGDAEQRPVARKKPGRKKKTVANLTSGEPPMTNGLRPDEVAMCAVEGADSEVQMDLEKDMPRFKESDCVVSNGRAAGSDKPIVFNFDNFRNQHGLILKEPTSDDHEFDFLKE